MNKMKYEISLEKKKASSTIKGEAEVLCFVNINDGNFRVTIESYDNNLRTAHLFTIWRHIGNFLRLQHDLLLPLKEIIESAEREVEDIKKFIEGSK